MGFNLAFKMLMESTFCTVSQRLQLFVVVVVVVVISCILLGEYQQLGGAIYSIFRVEPAGGDICLFQTLVPIVLL